ncbi:AAA family ATPase [Tsukamurella sp. NPDC003166]|uniref:AAA family ATPase n=1 Tax=Tsukamurella sp. NPDC003166 TaxID=3154444 RepID=UPI0033B8AC7A
MTASRDARRKKQIREEHAERARLDAAHAATYDDDILDATWTAAEIKADEELPADASPAMRAAATRRAFLDILGRADPLNKPTGGPQVRLRPMTDVKDDVPDWVWQPKPDYNAIAVGTVALLAGRPAAGKTTFARHFVAQATRGMLPGSWYGAPVAAGWIGGEESEQYVIKPGLRAAGADIEKVVIPEVAIEHDTDGIVTVPFLRHADHAALAAELRRAGVKVLVLDPIMSVIGAKADVNRSNEVRARLEPWIKVAEEIEGVVLGVAHLTKSFSGDVTAAINGSSAFGEVARSIWGFSKDEGAEDDARLMSHAKNSLGPEGLSFTYTLEPVEVTTDAGKTAQMTRFVLGEETDRTVSDAMREASSGGTGGPKVKSASDKAATLERILTGPQGERLQLTKEDVVKEMGAAGLSPDMTRRAREELARAGRIKAPFRKEKLGPYYWQLLPFVGERDHLAAVPDDSPEVDGNDAAQDSSHAESLPSCHPASDLQISDANQVVDGMDGSVAESPCKQVPITLHAVPDADAPQAPQTCRQWFDAHVCELLDAGARTAHSATVYAAGERAGWSISNLRKAASRSDLVAIAERRTDGYLWHIGEGVVDTVVSCEQWLTGYLSERGGWVPAGDAYTAGEAAGYGRTAVKSAAQRESIEKRGESILTEWRLAPEKAAS